MEKTYIHKFLCVYKQNIFYKYTKPFLWLLYGRNPMETEESTSLIECVIIRIPKESGLTSLSRQNVIMSSIK